MRYLVVAGLWVGLLLSACQAPGPVLPTPEVTAEAVSESTAPSQRRFLKQAISPDGRYLAVWHVTDQVDSVFLTYGSSTLSVVDLQTQQTLHRVALPDNVRTGYDRVDVLGWSDAQQLWLTTTGQTKTLYRLQVQTGALVPMAALPPEAEHLRLTPEALVMSAGSQLRKLAFDDLQLQTLGHFNANITALYATGKPRQWWVGTLAMAEDFQVQLTPLRPSRYYLFDSEQQRLQPVSDPVSYRETLGFQGQSPTGPVMGFSPQGSAVGWLTALGATVFDPLTLAPVHQWNEDIDAGAWLDASHWLAYITAPQAQLAVYGLSSDQPLHTQVLPSGNYQLLGGDATVAFVEHVLPQGHAIYQWHWQTGEYTQVLKLDSGFFDTVQGPEGLWLSHTEESGAYTLYHLTAEGLTRSNLDLF